MPAARVSPGLILNRPDLTATRFVPNPYSTVPGARLYRTGDRGRDWPDGQLEFRGRVDHQVKLRGFRIELGEIEAVLCRHDAVRDAIVVAREERNREKRLVAYVVGEAETSELRNYLQERLPDYMIPSAWVTLDALPLTANGKVDRKALPAPDSQRPELSSAYIAPRSAIERDIAEVWQEVLGIENIGVNDNFFDLGGHSLLLAQVQSRLARKLSGPLMLLDLFRYPTVASLAEFLSSQLTRVRPTGRVPPNESRLGEAPRHMSTSQDPALRTPAAAASADSPNAIAVIGMAGRFPDARNLEEFWRNLRSGVDAFTPFTDEEIRAAGVPEALLANPLYVKGGTHLERCTEFDAAFFGVNPREAEVTDPQQRIFLECAWEALESAGYAGEGDGAGIGVFAGASLNTYLLNNLLSNPELIGSVGPYQVMIGNDKDFLSTRVSYKLNLRGPSLTIQTACSTSLVAIHHACRSLLASARWRSPAVFGFLSASVLAISIRTG